MFYKKEEDQKRHFFLGFYKKKIKNAILFGG